MKTHTIDLSFFESRQACSAPESDVPSICSGCARAAYLIESFLRSCVLCFQWQGLTGILGLTTTGAEPGFCKDHPKWPQKEAEDMPSKL